MKFFLISDNVDTQLGMRMAGIEGIVAHTAEEVGAALDSALLDEEIAIVLMTEKTAALCPQRVREIRLKRACPLIAEIPDRHGNTSADEIIGRSIEQALGIKL